ncbi:zinc finger protein 853-like isoform X2 [Melanotaenia boesemani]|uniref:zinc finger protein 853-like isoform X2 n=1 Tax=Melanotaenia boesemani TaxID=1250792 RepID=UPI001C03CEA6|nr:zinc finger protein 853-like isoform X2 [Melanotaenia boesemani]
MEEEISCKESYLEEPFESFQLHCEEMENQKKLLFSKNEAKETDMAEGNKLLRMSVAAEKESVDELLDWLEAQQTVKQAAEAEHLQLSQQKQDQDDDLLEQNVMQSMALKEQEEQQMEVMQQLSTLELKEMLFSQEEDQEAEIHKRETEIKSTREKTFKDMQEKMEAAVTKTPRILPDDRHQHWDRLACIQQLENEAAILQEEEDAAQARATHMQRSYDELSKELSKTMERKIQLNVEMKQLWRMLQQQIEDSVDFSAQPSSPTETEDPGQSLILVSEGTSRGEEANSAQLEAELQNGEKRRREVEDEKQEAAIILRYILLSKSDSQWMTERLLEILDSCSPAVSSQDEELHTGNSRDHVMYETGHPAASSKCSAGKRIMAAE